MIVSPSLRLLYIKPRKVAGSSVELALSPLLGPGDMATPVNGQEEALRQTVPGVQIGRISGRGPLKLRDHSPLRRAVVVLGRGILDFHIVTTERNPWDRAVSQFFWSMRHTDMKQRPFAEQKRAFACYVRKWGPITWLDRVYGRKRQRSLSSIDMYSLGGRIMADRVLFYESLAGDLAKLGRDLGRPITLPELRAKSGIRPTGGPAWPEFYTPELRDFVGEICAREIAAFGYAFDPDTRPHFTPER